MESMHISVYIFLFSTEADSSILGICVFCDTGFEQP